MEQDSRGLVERASRGDAKAVPELLQRHLPGLQAFVRLHMGPALKARESGADLVQSVCLEVLQHLDRYRYQGEAQFKSWLYTTALRKISNHRRHWRAQKREAAREVEMRADEASDLLDCYRSFCTPSQDAAALELVAHIERAFARLPEDQRRVIVLARVVGLPRAEIGAEMGRSEVAVRSLLSRALSQLAEILEEGRGAKG
jgi:RNA polymerase sigma-70 factor (ECF subfamily)